MATRGRILIADDDRAIRTVLSQALGKEGYAVRATGNVATSATVYGLNVLNDGGVDTQAPTGTLTSPVYDEPSGLIWNA